MKATSLAILAVIAIHVAVLSSTARSDECSIYRPIWLGPSQRIPPQVARGNGPWTLNPLRFAERIDCHSSCTIPWKRVFPRFCSDCGCDHAHPHSHGGHAEGGVIVETAP
jgi:hypothetical protein